MPYIKPADRSNYDLDIESIIDFFQKPAHTLEHIPALLCQAIRNILIGSYQKWLPNYADYNEIIGVLECSKLEFLCRKNAERSLYTDKDLVLDKKTVTSLKKRTDRIVKSVLNWYENECTSTSGQLNYIITRLLLLTQSEINQSISPINILDSVKFDIYQNDIAPYEQIKEDENGSVATTFIG